MNTSGFEKLCASGASTQTEATVRRRKGRRGRQGKEEGNNEERQITG